jgi:hypothetical protein
MTMPIAPAVGTELLFNRYRNNQYAIGQRVDAVIRGSWMRMVDPEHFNDSWTRLEPLLLGIIDIHYGASAADAAQYYSMSRAIAGFYGRAVPGVSIRPDYMAHVVYIMGKGQFYHFLGDGNDAPASSGMALDALVGSGVRLVMNGGRDTVKFASSFDDNSLGWERIIESNMKACGYCSMLAGSGTVTKDFGVKFHAHDNCYCLARSVFKGQESVNSGIQAEWQSVTAGKQGNAAKAAWNQYWSEKNVGPEGGGPAGTPQEEAGNAPVAGEPE